MTNSKTLLKQILGTLQKDVPYPKKLPDSLENWHCYPMDCGHSILAVLESAYLEEQPIANSLLPIPVKTVLASYKIVDGFVFCTNPAVKYSPILGMECPPEDVEF